MKYVAVLITFALASACSDATSDAETPWLVDDDPTVDGKADTTRPTTQDEGPDITPGPTEVELRTPTDLSDWNMERPCQLETPVQAPSQAEYSPRSGGSASRLTVSEFDLSGADMPFLEVIPEERHGTAFDYAYDLHAVPGDDVILHVYAANADMDGARFSVTALVDYEPVVATYTYWRQDRGGVIAESNAAGFQHDVVDDFVIVDIVIPADNFQPGKLHEIGLAVTWPGNDQAHHGDETRRFPLFYGGWDVPRELPCATRPASVPPNEFEAEVLDANRGANHVGIFVDPMPTSRTAHMHEFRAAPGEVVRVYASVFPQLDVEPDRNIVAVPLLNGIPVGEPRWFGQTGAEEVASIETVFTHINPTVNMRYYFDVQMPDEPGTYDVQVTTWADPFVRWRNLDAEPEYGFMNVTNGDNRAGSNVLTFEVASSF